MSIITGPHKKKATQNTQIHAPNLNINSKVPTSKQEGKEPKGRDSVQCAN